MNTAPERVFIDYSKTYADINALAPNWEIFFADEIRNLKDDDQRRAFKKGFAKAVTGEAVTASEYEIATGWDFDSEDEYRAHLRKLWNIFYPTDNPDDCV